MTELVLKEDHQGSGKVMTAGVISFLVGALLMARPVYGGEAKSRWQNEWERTVAAAKRESQVVIYTQGSKQYLFDRFQEAFPGVKIISTFGATGAQLASRIMAERRAGKYLADIYYVGAETHITVLHPAKVLEPLSSALILPEVRDESRWFQGKHQYADPEGRYSLIFEGTVSGGIAHNTKLVRASEISSYRDLLNPKWKGKIVAFDPRGSGHSTTAFWFLYSHEPLGPDFLRRLFLEAGLTLSRDFRQPVDWLSTGKYLLCYACQGVEEGHSQGLPVDTLTHSLKEGTHLAPRGSVVALINRAPHPNAARVFINWLLSREGQMAFQKMSALEGSGADSLRVDIPKSDVAPNYRRREGAKYFIQDVTERIRSLPQMRKFIDELLSERERRKD